MSWVKYFSNESIYFWIQNELFLDIVINKKWVDKLRIVIMNLGGICFDIFVGRFICDSIYFISLFVSGFCYVFDVLYSIVKCVIGILNSGIRILSDNGFMDICFFGILE